MLMSSMAGKAVRSIQALSAEVANDPNSTAFVELAAAYRERGDVERALRLCLRGLQRHPTHVEAHHELGRIYEARGERELALDEWSIVRQLAPEHLPARLATVRLYLQEGRTERAETELRAAEELAPDNATIAELWQELESTRAQMADGGPPVELFAEMGSRFPGILGVLLVNSKGQVLEGQMTPRGLESDRSLALNLSGAKREAARVASYLILGDLKTVVIESGMVRLTIAPVGDAVVILATASELPPGQAALALRRAVGLAEQYVERHEG